MTSSNTSQLQIANPAVFQLIIDSIPFRIFWKDVELKYCGCNKQFCLDAGIESPEQILGLTDFDLPWSREEAEFYRSCDTGVMKKNEPQPHIVETQMRADGQQEWLETSKIPLNDNQDNVLGILGVYHDITDLKKAEQEAVLECQKLEQELISASRKAGREEIATGVLHNIGNVMNSVNVGNSILKENLVNDIITRLEQTVELFEEQENFGDFINNDPRGQHFLPFLKQLVHRTKDFEDEIADLQTKIEHVNSVIAAQQMLATGGGGIRGVVQLQTVVENALKILDEELRNCKIQVETEFCQPAELVSDQQRIVQVVINIIQNAINAINDYGSEQKMISIKIEPGDAGSFVISITDTGIGISPENLDRIFQHGFSTRKNDGGCGFGLHHSINSIEEIGGKLEARSRGVGTGATFELKIIDGRLESDIYPIKLPSETLSRFGSYEASGPFETI